MQKGVLLMTECSLLPTLNLCPRRQDPIVPPSALIAFVPPVSLDFGLRGLRRID